MNNYISFCKICNQMTHGISKCTKCLNKKMIEKVKIIGYLEGFKYSKGFIYKVFYDYDGKPFIKLKKRRCYIEKRLLKGDIIEYNKEDNIKIYK